MGCSFNVGNDSLIGTESGFLDRSTRKLSSDNTLHNKRLVQTDLAPQVMKSQTTTDSSSCRTPVDFTPRKHTHIPAVNAPASRRTDKDRPVQKIQVLLEGMGHLSSFDDGAFNAHAFFDKLAVVFRGYIQAHLFCPDIGIKSTTEGEVVLHSTQLRHCDGFVKSHDKRRNILEIDTLDLPLLNLGAYFFLAELLDAEDGD